MSDISLLAAQKSFAELDPEQRAEVLAEMPGAEYDRLHLVLRAARSLDAEAEPPAALGERLHARMVAQAKPRPGIATLPLRLLQLRLPAWQAAAAIVLALLAGRFFSTAPPAITPQSMAETGIVHDTIFQEKTLWKERVVVRWRMAERVRVVPEAPHILPDSIEKDPFFAEKPAEPIDLESNPASVGVRLSEQPDLMQFFTRPGEGER